MEQALAVPGALHGRIHEEDYELPFWRSHISPRHVHRFVEVYLSLRGRAEVLIGDARVPIPAGSLWWIPPGIEHEVLEVSPTHRRFNLAMRTSALRRVVEPAEAALLLGRGAPGPHCVQLDRAELTQLASVFRDSAALHDRGATAYNAGLAYALARALLAYRDAAPTGEPATLHPAVAAALALMRGDGLSLDRGALAARVGVTPTHLSRLFARELGRPLTEIRSRRRVARVAELMRAGTPTLTQAALEAGFGSYSQFHRVHCRWLGHPPSGPKR